MGGFQFGMSCLVLMLVVLVAELVEEYKYGQDV